MEQTREIKLRFGFFSSFKMLTTRDLGADYWAAGDETLWNAKGHAYYSWKPYAILHSLESEIPNGDILLYSDAGCSFPQMSRLEPFLESLAELSRRVGEECRDSILLALDVWPHHPFGCSDCCLSLLDFFGLTRERLFTHGFPHYEAGVIVMKNTAPTRNFVRLWWDVMMRNMSALFAESHKGLPEFQNNSCDLYFRH